MDLDRLGITDVPASWRQYAPVADRFDKPDWLLPAHAVRVFGLPLDVLAPLEEVLAAIRRDGDLTALADLWHYLICHLPGDTGDNPSLWPLPIASLGELAPLFPLAVVVSATDDALEAFQRAGASTDVALTTLSYSGYFVRDYRKKCGAWGLSELGWLRNFVRGELFQLGRLSFRPVVYDWPFRAFRNRRDGSVVTLCEPSTRFQADGLAGGTNGVFDAEAWSPTLEIGRDVIAGHPASDDGRALAESVALDARDWEQILASGEHVIEVHIPAENGKLTPEACADSYRRAVDFFTGRCPRGEYAAFTCWSWLLDPGLAQMLPPESNIVRFQRAFHPVPVAGDESQAYDLVFGDSAADPVTISKTTALQRAIADYAASGSKLRSGAGYMLWDEVAARLRAAATRSRGG